MRQERNVYPGDRFGRLTVIGESDRKYGHRYILCQCDCGSTKTINLNSLVVGSSNSCGCFRRERITKMNYKHGLTKRSEKLEKLYSVWGDMKGRCNNPKDKGYHNYGGRGIKVCDEWANDYSKFREWALNNGYAEKLSIDRIDNDGDYEPSNCRWTTMQVQSNNTRFNHFVTYKGETHTLADWGRLLNIDSDKIGRRLKKGLPLEQVFFDGNLRHYNREKEKTK